MFEIGIFCVIVFAVAYWAVLFIMGRRNYVLHGEFVEPDAESKKAPQPFPGPVARPAPVTAQQNAAPAPLAKLPPANTEALQLLLISLKQELKNASQI